MGKGFVAVQFCIVLNKNMKEQEKYIIDVRNLSKTFKTRGNKNIFTGLKRPDWQYTKAVIDASFHIERGESVAFLGPNGAGKTTTTKMLTGIMYPTSGSVHVLGYKPQKRDPKFLQRIGLVMGNKSGLNWDLTARQSYSLLKDIYQLEDSAYEKQLATMSQLLSIDNLLDKQVRQLSLGERMKVELISALLHEPEVLFLDEPTIGLDIDAKFAMREFLIELQKERNVTIILTSHDMDDIEHVCQRVLVINKGKLIFNDALQKLNARYAKWHYVRLTFSKDVDENILKAHGKLLKTDGYSHLLKVDNKRLVNSVAAFGAIPGLTDITIESVPLERIVSDLFSK